MQQIRRKDGHIMKRISVMKKNDLDSLRKDSLNICKTVKILNI
jgi:hypothetical protein